MNRPVGTPRDSSAPEKGADAKLATEVQGGAVAYRDIPLTLTAAFTHPGSTGGHTALWDTGDEAPQPAVVREEVDAAGAHGRVLLTHRYAWPATYDGASTVSDGSTSAEARTGIRCVELLNGGFELGFRDTPVGQVANYWQPYAPQGQGTASALAASAQAAYGVYTADEFIVHGGRRAQRIAGQRAFRCGLVQKLAVTRGWDYQVTAWYQLAGTAGGFARVGVDPAGGLDPNASSVVWSLGTLHLMWMQLAVRVTASTAGIMVFLEAGGTKDGARVAFDDVVVIPYPCPPHDPILPPAS